jgi:hypothetical protein
VRTTTRNRLTKIPLESYNPELKHCLRNWGSGCAGSRVIGVTSQKCQTLVTFFESLYEQTEESKSVCRSRTSTNVPTPRTDAPQAHRAARTHTGDRPSHTNNTEATLAVCDSEVGEADVLDSIGKPREQAKKDEIKVY